MRNRDRERIRNLLKKAAEDAIANNTCEEMSLAMSKVIMSSAKRSVSKITGRNKDLVTFDPMTRPEQQLLDAYEQAVKSLAQFQVRIIRLGLAMLMEN